jgi:hypothetical protein
MAKLERKNSLTMMKTKDFMIALDIMCVSQVNIHRIKHGEKDKSLRC